MFQSEGTINLVKCCSEAEKTKKENELLEGGRRSTWEVELKEQMINNLDPGRRKSCLSSKVTTGERARAHQ